MSKKWTIILCAVFLTMIISLNGGLAFAGDYTVDWWRVQKRTFESGSSVNRLAFTIKDGYGNTVPTDVVKTILLIGPEGGTVSLTPHDFYTYDILSGFIDTSSGGWIYDSEFLGDNYCTADFSEDLVEGNYTLTIIDTDEEAMIISPATRNFGGIIELPQISSKSFRGFQDAGGNLLWQWDPPADMAMWSVSSDVDLRCMLDIFLGDDYIGMVWINVPSTVGGTYIPSDVMDLVRQKGDNFKLQLQIRDIDNNNRYYTNEVALNALREERSKAVVVIPMF